VTARRIIVGTRESVSVAIRNSDSNENTEKATRTVEVG
jgi:hypothetical protein